MSPKQKSREMKYERGNKCHMTSHWLWVLTVNPLLIFTVGWRMVCPGQLLCSCSLPVILTHLLVRKKEFWWPVCHSRVFFQTYACCMDTFLYFHTRTWETFWLLGTWSEEHWVSLVSDPLCLGHSLYIQYQHVQQGHFRFFFVLSFKKTLQFNMAKRSTPMIFTEPVG